MRGLCQILLGLQQHGMVFALRGGEGVEVAVVLVEMPIEHGEEKAGLAGVIHADSVAHWGVWWDSNPDSPVHSYIVPVASHPTDRYDHTPRASSLARPGQPASTSAVTECAIPVAIVPAHTSSQFNDEPSGP